MTSSYLDELRSRVEQRLARFFEQKQAEAAGHSLVSVDLGRAVATFVLRGGKRLRPALVEAAFLAIAPHEEVSAVTEVGAAMELLHGYLLIHDDWMDCDLTRRGHPTVHATLRKRHRDQHLADSVAILAGDLAAAYALEMLASAPVPKERMPELMQTFWQMQQEVIFGQHLDLLGTGDVALVESLKTGSYTVRGPLRMGACAAGAGSAQLSVFDDIARPLGLAFQLRDDMLGLFGDTARTGKPVGADLRAGKRTALVVETERLGNAAQRAALDRALGQADVTQAELDDARDAVEASGAKQRIEDRIGALLDEVHGVLMLAPFDSAGARRLIELADAMAMRDH